MDDSNQCHSNDAAVDKIARAIYIVNRHAKTAPNPKFLYSLKKKALEKLLSEGKAKKIGLHYSNNPKYSQQQSDVLVYAGQYFFHMPPTKEDFQNLPHLGSLNETYRNPKVKMSLSKAKAILQQYVGYHEPNHIKKRKHRNKRTYQKPVFKRLGERYF